jgi:hypothetical protein
LYKTTFGIARELGRIALSGDVLFELLVVGAGAWAIAGKLSSPTAHNNPIITAIIM